MHLVKLETQGESPFALVNPGQVAYLAQSIYGTAVHFASGEYIVCLGELEDVARLLFGDAPTDAYLIASAGPAPA